MRTNRSGIACALAFGALLLTADSAGAQTVRACFNSNNGNLRLVTSPADCRTNETFVTWNASGAAGATGATGSVGPTGPAGTNGAIGPTGPAGTNGVNGAVGPTGPAGTNGVNGAVGPTGPAGTNGVNGAIGPTGPQGPTGAVSSTPPTFAVFSLPPTPGPAVPHFSSAQWVLEALDAGTLQLRSTGNNFYVFSFIAPTSCSGQTSATSESFRFSFGSIGDTLTAAFCTNIGSTILVTVSDFSQAPAVFNFRCQRTHANANICQRLF